MPNLQDEKFFQKWARYVQAKAPRTRGHGTTAYEKASMVAKVVFERVPQSSINDVFRLLAEHWSPSCIPPWGDKALRTIVARAQHDTYNVIPNNSAAPRTSSTWKERAAIKRKAEETRKADAESNKLIATRLKCTPRYARMIRSDGTTNPAHAAVLADVLGTCVEDHLKLRRRSGPQADLVGWLMKAWAPNATFRDFIDDAYDVPKEVGNFSQILRNQRGDARLGLQRIETMEQLVLHTRALDDMPRLETVSELWKAYKIWRIEHVATLATYTIKNVE